MSKSGRLGRLVAAQSSYASPAGEGPSVSPLREQPLEVRDQILVDGWRRITNLVAEVNAAAPGFEYPLIAWPPLTPTDQR